jgi:hypothetical protein
MGTPLPSQYILYNYAFLQHPSVAISHLSFSVLFGDDDHVSCFGAWMKVVTLAGFRTSTAARPFLQEQRE